MGRFLFLLAVLLLLAFAPMRMARGDDAQPVFFSLLFPQLMPDMETPAWLAQWLGVTGEAELL